jgi:hypothetical protein
MRRLLTLGAVLVAVIGRVPTAQARTVEYMSQHPLPRKIGRGFCYIDVPHFHDFPPSDPRLYRQVAGQYYFVGDPAPFDYEGPRYSFYGPHPVVEASVQAGPPIYCYLQGPHYHWYQPTAGASFELKGGAYWYVGAYPAQFYDDRPRYVVVNEAYAPIAYTRPVVDVTVAPPGFRGEIIAGGPGWRARAAVGAPVVGAGVYVAAPPPPSVQIGVGINLGGGPSAVIEPRRDVVEVRERHEHGPHGGWNGHGHEDGWRGPPPPPHANGWRGGPAPPAPGAGWRGGPAPAPAPAAGWRAGPRPMSPPAAHPGGNSQQKHGSWKR